MTVSTLHKRIARLALTAVPNEVCGFVVEGKAIAVPNQAVDSTECFLISAQDFLKYDPNTIFHSHPTGHKGFSDHDLAVAANMELTSYVYVVEADRLEYWSPSAGLQIYEKVLNP